MSPKRRYQSSSVGIGLPPPPLPPPEYFANLTYSYSRPITSSEIAVNPCLTSKKIPTAGGAAPSTTTKKGSKPGDPTVGGGEDHNHQHPIKQSQQKSTGNSSKGNRTYRVRHHHQNHYEPPVPSYHNQISNSTTAGGDQSRPTSSLSQGIFGLPAVQDYFSHNRYEDNLHEETLSEQHPPPPPKPRMKTTLPSFKNILPPLQEASSYHHHSHHYPSQEDMDGVIQVRPASRQSRTRPEYSSSGGGGPMRRSTGGGGGGARRRVQSTVSFHPHANKPSTPTETSTHHADSSHPITADVIDSILHKLKSQDSDWEEIVDGFHSIVRLTSDSPSSINKGNLRKIIMSGLPHLSSSRTKLSRAACQCFKILYETQRRAMEGEGDKVFHRLLDLCGGPQNKFIQDECKVALLAAVKNTDPIKCLHLLELYGARHRNPNVREFVAQLLLALMESVGSVDKLLSKEFAPRMLPMIIGFLREGQLNTRLNGKQCLGKVFFHPDFQFKLRKYVPPETIRHVQDTLKKFQQPHQNQQKRSSTAAARTIN